MTESAESTAIVPKPVVDADSAPPKRIDPAVLAAQNYLPVTEIDPPKGWQLINARELWRYRELLFFLAWRDVKVRYKQTALGAAWAVIQPVMMMVVFNFVFARMAKVSSGNVAYPVFSFAGLLPWTFFQTAVSSAANSVVGSERLITKIYFPRLAIPFAAVGAALVDFGIALVALFVLMAWYHIMPTARMFMVLPLIALVTLAALGVGTLLAALTVAYRDFKYVLPFLMQVWLFATPTIYMDVSQTAGPRTHILMLLNPLVSIVSSFRAAMLGEPLPWRHLALASVYCVAAMLIGCLYFRRVEDSFADVI
ncbi:MAG TPA: ABC transporter permease [Tepidisphaeraceae bacterium]|nr:ABC transporter permease [Tepidisphaeraceae bacterium]